MLILITELPWDILIQEWFDPGVHAFKKDLALFLDDSLCCFVGLFLRLAHGGLVFSYPHMTVAQRETDELFWQVWWRARSLSAPESSAPISLT